MNVCTRCMRVLRQQARFELLQTELKTSAKSSRAFTTTIRTRRQEDGANTKPTQQTESTVPPFMPTTTPTITSNITADKPTPPPPPPPPSSASTSDMQRAISSNLEQSRIASSLGHKLAVGLRSAAKSTTETYITYGLTDVLFKSCAAQAPYTVPEEQRGGVYVGKGPQKNARGEDVGVPEEGVRASKGAQSWWFTTIGLEPTFSTWSQVCFLHMYILLVKLRTLPDEKAYLDHQRYLIEHFSNAAEDKMALLHNMNARGIRNRYLKDLFMQWRGIQFAYDQGLVSGDAVLAGAVWRNLWKADEDVDWNKVALVVAYMRRAIAGLADADIQALAAEIKDSSKYWESAQSGLEQMVQAQSKGIRETPTDPPVGENQK